MMASTLTANSSTMPPASGRGREHKIAPIASRRRYVCKPLHLGIGYRGTVADIRQSDRGETLAITLGEPARLLFELKPGKTDTGYGKSDHEPAFVRYAEEEVGSVVALDARVIQNIVVANRRSSQLALLNSLEDERLETAPAHD